jgi:hypothetical protein
MVRLNFDIQDRQPVARRLYRCWYWREEDIKKKEKLRRPLFIEAVKVSGA